MDLAQVLEMKAQVMDELSKIDTRRKAMENTLAGLSLWEQTLRGTENRPDQPVSQTQLPGMNVSSHLDEGPLPYQRVDNALSRIHGLFPRSKLKNDADNDGLGPPIAVGTFGNIFGKLRKRKQIIVGRGKEGKRSCLYIKSEEAHPAAHEHKDDH